MKHALLLVELIKYENATAPLPSLFLHVNVWFSGFVNIPNIYIENESFN